MNKKYMILGVVILIAVIGIILFMKFYKKEKFSEEAQPLPSMQELEQSESEECRQCKDRVAKEMCVGPNPDGYGCMCQQSEICQKPCGLRNRMTDLVGYNVEPLTSVEGYENADSKKLNCMAWNEFQSLYQGDLCNKMYNPVECYTGCSGGEVDFVSGKEVCRLRCDNVCDEAISLVKDTNSFFTEEDLDMFKQECSNSCKITTCGDLFTM